MKKKVLIVAIIAAVILCIFLSGYIILRRTISGDAVKSRLLSMTKDFGEAEIDYAKVSLLEGLIIRNFSFTGTSEEVQGKSVKIPKIVLKHSLQSLFKGKLTMKSAVIISPELTIEEPSEIWSLLNTIKEHFDKMEMPPYVDIMQDGVTIRDLKVHIKGNKQTNSPEIRLSGINIFFQPFAGTFENIIAEGNIDDEFLGNYFFSMRLYPGVPRLDIAIHATNLMLNEVFFTKFPYLGNMLWADYKPVGKVALSCVANFDNKDNQKKMDYSINVGLNGIKGTYAEWPFLISDLSGTVLIDPDKLYLKDLVGYIMNGGNTSPVKLKGEFDLHSSKKTFYVMVPNLFVNQDILKNISGIGEQVWLQAQPEGFVDVTFQYNEGVEENGSYFLVVDCKGLEVKPQGLPFPLSYINGQFKMANNIILINNISGLIKCGDQSIVAKLHGVYDIESGRKIFNLHAPNVFITEAFLNGLSEKGIGTEIWQNLNPRGRVELIAHYQGFKEGENDDYLIEINLKDGKISIGEKRIPVWGIEGRVELDKQGLVTRHIHARCYEGYLEGDLSITRDADTYRYEGGLSITRANIKELAAAFIDTKKPLFGYLSGKIKYEGVGTDLSNFSAAGQLEVSDGYLSDVPILLHIFKFFNLGMPARDRFHSAKAQFDIKDGIVYLHKGGVFSDSIELTGQGKISLTGELDLTVVAGFDKGILVQIPIIGRLIDFVVGGVQKQLSMVEIKGEFSNPQIRSVPFRPITRTIRSIFDVLPEEELEISNTTDNK
ncbi:MAG: hypothetical protein ACUBOA_02550 [Candidatus Loosdrechtia sp.]|uniref:hypothetical protein n=1 Tax=Candidatus Loosdrechtia sp. TaxID=3101272 RepID=UPI003A63D956|nr:MAG: AsmA-like C-terminal region-containing protein [Candidatus Jettenia sp. AMX2]